jgi:hypothetical protein
MIVCRINIAEQNIVGRIACIYNFYDISKFL